MKKLSLLLIGLAVTLCTTANVRVHGNNAARSLDKSAAGAPARVDIITEQPEGTVVTYARSGEFLTVSLYGYATDQQVGQTKVCYAEDGKTVYIQDPLAYGEGVGAWAKGELSDDGKTITVPLGQLVSYNEEYDYGLMLSWGSTTLVEFEDEDGPYYWLMFDPDPEKEAVTYSVDAENGTITLEGGEGDAGAEYPNNLKATGLAGVWSDDGTIATMEWKTVWTALGEVAPATPANPEATEFFDSGSTSGYTRFDFNINLMDTEGKQLNSDYVTYSIFTDNDELFTFDWDTYGALNGFDEDMTEIPYGYSGEDFYLRRVYFYRTNMGDDPMFKWRIGIQTHYTVDGVRNSSDIVYLEVYDNPYSAVNGIEADKQVAGVRYYNLAGQEVAQPEGVTIQVTTYADGTSKAVKLVK